MMDDNYHLKVIDFATAKLIGKTFNRETMKFEDIAEQPVDLKEDSINNNEDDNEEIICKQGETFVGTAEYVSPEVLTDNPAHFGSDIWALGCMVYWMYNGKTPFKEKTDYLTFQRIKENKVEYPDTMPDDAKDLIQKIWVFDPEKRWGAGSCSSESEMKKLKNHQFFKGIDFNTLHNTAPPYKEQFREMSSQDLKKEEKPKQCNIDEYEGIVPKLINGKYQILKEAIIEKKSSWFYYNTRKIILDTVPKWEIIDPDGGQVKGVIMLDKSCWADYLDNIKFLVKTPKRIYKFKAYEEGDGFVWVRAINDAIRLYSE